MPAVPRLFFFSYLAPAYRVEKIYGFSRESYAPSASGGFRLTLDESSTADALQCPDHLERFGLKVYQPVGAMVFTSRS